MFRPFFNLTVSTVNKYKQILYFKHGGSLITPIFDKLRHPNYGHYGSENSIDDKLVVFDEYHNIFKLIPHTLTHMFDSIESNNHYVRSLYDNPKLVKQIVSSNSTISVSYETVNNFIVDDCSITSKDKLYLGLNYQKMPDYVRSFQNIINNNKKVILIAYDIEERVYKVVFEDNLSPSFNYYVDEIYSFRRNLSN